MIENKFLHYETQSGYEADKENIDENSIVFVKSSKRIYTHGECYDCRANYKLDLVNIWKKLEDITGEQLLGFDMEITPNYFISEDGADVHISVNTGETSDVFEHIAFYADDILITEAFNVEHFEYDFHIDKTTVIMCEAKITGVEYTRQLIITKYDKFYIGAGTTYTEVMNSAHAKLLNGTMRHNYNVMFDEGDKLIIVIGASLRDGFIRADLNGIEIEFTELTVTIDGEDYVVLTSEAWGAGEYNIDING